MNPSDLIESYVDDIAKRLPRKLRNDVGFELRALLGEELQGKASDADRPADEAMALALLNAFGRPEDVADRYRPASFVIIKSSETRGFALTALLAVAVQWALTLPPVFMLPELFPGQAFSRLGAWWTSWGLGAFWLPGFMVVAFIIVRWIGHRWPRADAWAPPRLADRDRINRPLTILAMGAWTLGAAVWIGMPWYGPHLPGVLPSVFAFDDGFLRARGPWLLPLWAAQYGVYMTALVDGRWLKITRRIRLGLDLALCGLLAWFTAAGPIFVSKTTDASGRGLLCLVVLISLISVSVTLYREQARVGRPKGLAGAPGA
ncbi:MAG: hypothetical protein ACHP7N_00525 [Caulobacterales bacterium]